MSIFPTHTRETAPEGSRPVLDGVAQKYGFVPNLFAKLAEAPAAAETYVALSDVFSRTSLTPVEQQVVLLAVSQLNACEYCMTAHTFAAERAQMPEQTLDALRRGEPVPDDKLEALRRFTEQVVQERGWVSEDTVEDLIAAGFTKQNVLEILIGVSMKTFSNYVNHIVQTPIDEAFAPKAWKKAG